MIGVAPAGVRPEIAPAPAPAPAAIDEFSEADLPTVGQPQGKGGIPRAPVPRPGAAPPRPQPRAAAAKPPAPAPDFAIDLPSPVAPKAAVGAPPAPQTPDPGDFALDDLDLPAPRAPSLQKPLPETQAFGPMDLDLMGADDLGAADAELPMPRQAASLDLDLPAVGERSEQRAPSFDELDLPSPRPPEAESFDDLPALPNGGAGDFGFGELDLPSPGARPDLPAPSFRHDLPLPARGADLPVPSREHGLLPTTGGAGLPASVRPGGRSVFELDAPAASDDEFALEPPRPPPARAVDPSAGFGDRFGEISLPGDDGGPAEARGRYDRPLESDPFGDVDLPPPVSRRPPPSEPDRHMAATMPADIAEVTRSAGGGVSYGEVNLDGGSAPAVPLDEAPPRSHVSGRPPEEAMEFGGVPQETAPAGPGRVAVPAMVSVPRARRRVGVRVFAAFFIVAVGGASLALVPDIGPFGAFWISDQLKADEYARLLSGTVASSRKSLGRDTATDAKKASATAESAQHQAKRVTGLKAYAAFVGYARELRFGLDAPVRARAKVLLDELAEVESAPYLSLARAARAAVEGDIARARSMVQALEQQSPRDPDVLVLKGELFLRGADPGAVSAWEAADKVEQSARTAYGLARAKYAKGELPAAEKAARQALEKNSEHVGARIMLARVTSADRSKEASALELLTSVIKAPDSASSQEVVAAQTLLADLHLSRSRISLAEAAYGAALKIDPKSSRALTGLGEAIFRAGRYSEALARFEAASQADPQDLDAAVGVAKSKLLLERADDALAVLKKLSAANPKSIRVAYWYGRALESLGAREQALGVYGAALKNPTTDPGVVDLYVAQALLLSQLGKSEQAKATLQAASTALPGSPAIPRALGEIALTDGRVEQAVVEFQ
ncbi:MAG TPA: tetratricopeptide repeat protein, partial [Polyangiaceae bacterium]|nr:tetratricopeptide repeat protein [Polyangiaceae bacterium]